MYERCRTLFCLRPETMSTIISYSCATAADRHYSRLVADSYICYKSPQIVRRILCKTPPEMRYFFLLHETGRRILHLFGSLPSIISVFYSEIKTYFVFKSFPQMIFSCYPPRLDFRCLKNNAKFVLPAYVKFKW